MRRHQAEGDQGLLPQGRQPHTSPQATPDAIVQQILELRKQHPRWGGRKIRQWLIQHGQVDMPSEKTINRILKRQGCINPEESAKHRPLIRFEHAHPND